MRFNRLDLNLLVALDILLIERNITRAAQRLNLSQSATSGALGRLRQFFKDDLLVQVGRKMEPTILAKSLADPVRELILRTQAVLDTTTDFVPSTASRHFRIGASDYIVTVLLSKLPRLKGDKYPGLTFEFVTVGDNIRDALRGGEIDILVIPEHFAEQDFPKAPLFEENYSCVIWSGNTKVGERLTFEEYMGMSHITSRFGRTRQASFEDWFVSQFERRRKVEFFAGDFSSIVQLLIGTELIATMHTTLAKHHSRYLPLRILPLPLDIPPIKECLQWHPMQEDDVGHRWLRSLLKSLVDHSGAL